MFFSSQDELNTILVKTKNLEGFLILLRIFRISNMDVLIGDIGLLSFWT
jgi:hypothetical protein